MSDEPWAELGDTVSSIREQLQEAMERGEGERLRFRTGPVELEFTVAVRKEGGARTKVLVLPWTVEAKGQSAAERTHKVRITLQPVDEHGDDLRIAADSMNRPA